MNTTPIIGIDLAKNIFQVCLTDEHGKVRSNKAVKRPDLLGFITRQRLSLIVMEACAGAHYWARQFAQLGHRVRLIAPQYLLAFRFGQKNDRNDALALALVGTRSGIPSVPVKTVQQQDWQCRHRVRDRLVKNRTALVNQIRGLLLEYGIVVAQGIDRLRARLAGILEDAEQGLSDDLRQLLCSLYEEWVALDERIARQTQQIKTTATTDEACRRLMAIAGVGPLVATALVAAMGNGHDFRQGRQVAAWLGLVPRQHSSGGKCRLGGISKRGDSYVRRLLIHGARAVISHIGAKTDPQSQWVRQLVARAGKNRACVALANKIARVAWALLHTGQPYRQPGRISALVT